MWTITTDIMVPDLMQVHVIPYKYVLHKKNLCTQNRVFTFVLELERSLRFLFCALSGLQIL